LVSTAKNSRSMKSHTFLILLFVAAALCAKRSNVNLEMSTHSASVRALKLQDGERNGAVGFTFSTIGFPRFRTRMYRVGEEPARVALDQFRAGLLSALEVNLQNETLGFQPEVDEVLANYTAWRGLAQTDLWSALVANNETDPDTGAIIRTLETHFTPRGYNEWMFQLMARISDMPVVNGTRRLAPTSFKFDINIKGFPYNATQTDSRMVLKFAVEHSGNFIRGNATTSDEDDVSAGRTRFGWVRSCLADGVESPVLATRNLIADDGDALPGDDDRDPTEARKLMYFTFPAGHPALVEWDPILDAVPDAVPESGAMSIRPSLWLALAALVALIALIL